MCDTYSVPGGTDFVYERDHDAFARLDDYCNWNQMSEPAAPLVVSGPSGSGKSALLANWLLHYRRRLEKRPKHGGASEKILIFCHAVGCTRHGVEVDQLLWRLLADVKQRFDLVRNVPNEAERLSWELPRFLDLAAREGRVIIVVDGLHRLQDKNGGEIGLQWLPLRIPGNVRIIVTATHPDPNYLQLHELKIRQHMANPHQSLLSSQPSDNSNGVGDTHASGGGSGGGSTGKGKSSAGTGEEGEAEYESSHRRRKVLMELSRRKWPTLELGPLQNWRKRDIVEAFLRRSLSGTRTQDSVPSTANSDCRPKPPHASSEEGIFLTGVDMKENGTIGLGTGTVTSSVTPGGSGEPGSSPGLVLFPSMIESILSNDATSSALYLRTLLRALDWAAKNAYDVRALLKNMLNTTTVGQLYNVFFDSNPTETSIRIAEQDNEAEGGKQALQDVIDALGGEMPLNSLDSSSSAESHTGGNRHRQRQQQQHSAVASERPGHVNDAVVGVDAAQEGQTSGNMASDKLQVVEGANDNAKGEGNDCSEEGNEEEDAGWSEGEGDEYSEEGYEDSDFEEIEEGEQVKVGRNKSPPEDGASSTKFQEAAMTDGINQEQGTDGGTQASMSREEVGPGPTGSEPTQNRAGNVFGVTDESRSGGLPSRAFALSEVPVYLSGGTKASTRVQRLLIQVEGFGVKVGRAVALLHVVRHGLRSQELWSLLAALEAYSSAQEKAEGTEGEAESRLLRKLLRNQNRLIDSIRQMDTDRDGVVSTAEFRAAIVSMNLGLTDRQVEKLIHSIDVDNDGELDMQSARKGEFESSTWSDFTEEDAGDTSSLSDGAKASLKSALSVLGVCHDGLTHNGEEHSIFVLGLDAEDLREVVSRRYVTSDSAWHSRLVRFFQAQPPSPRRCEELPWHLKKCYRWHPLKNSLVNLRTFETMWTTTQLRRELMDYWKLLTEGPLHASEEAAAADLRNDSKSRLVSLMMQESCNRGMGGSSVSAADIIAVGNDGNGDSSGKVAPFDLVFEYNHAVEGWQALGRPTISRLGEMVHTISDFMREMSQLVQKEYARSPPFLHMPLDFKTLESVGINPDLIAWTGADATPALREGAEEHVNARNKDDILAKPKGAPKDKLSYYRVAPFYYFQRWLWVQFPWMALSGSSAGVVSAGPAGARAATTVAAEGFGFGSGGNSGVGDRGDGKGALPDKSRRFWRVKRIDPFGEPSVNVSEDRLRSRLKAEVGRSVTTTLLDTQSHYNLLNDVGAGMASNAAHRRHALRVEAEETFGKPPRAKQPRTLASVGSAPLSTNNGTGGRGGFLSEDDSDLNSAIVTSPADLKSLGIGRDVLASIVGGGDLMGQGGGIANDGDGSAGSKARSGIGGGRGRGRNSGLGASHYRRALADGRKAISVLAGTNPLSPLPGKALVETGSFLGTSISIFPMSMDEEMVHEAKDMALKLRHIHDALQGEVKRKTKRLIEIKRGVEERNSQDAYTMSRTMAGENMIKALETRFTKVRSTSAELDRVGAFYGRIIELCVGNPPKDNRHLRALEEQVFLSKQQTTDLSGKVQKLLFEKDDIERLGIDGLRVQLARTKAVRQKVNVRAEQLREQIEKNVKSERRGLKAREAAMHLDGSSTLPRGTTVLDRDHPSMHGVGVTALVATGKVYGAARRAQTQSRLFGEEELEREGMEEALEQLAMVVGAEHVDDIAEKFKDIEARAQDLQAQGQSCTVTVEKLRKKLERRQKTLSDLQVVDRDASAGGSSTPCASSGNSNLHREQRRLDDLVFQSGIRLAQSTRKALKAKGDFTDLRVGVLHLASLIDSVVRQADDHGGALILAKSRVQQLLAKELSNAAAATDVPSAVGGVAAPTPSTAAESSGPGGAAGAGAGVAAPALAEGGVSSRVVPLRDMEDPLEGEHDVDHPDGSGLVETIPVEKDEDVCKLLEACERRVCRVMEASGLGGSVGTKESVSDSDKNVDPQRPSFWHSGINTATVPPGSEPVTEGEATPSVLDRLFMGQTKGLKGDGAGMDIRVFPPKARDTRFERSMGDALRQQNEKLEMQETEASNLDRNAVATGVASFLEDALNSKSANKHLRRANMLVMGKQGKRAGFGLVMDDVLSGADIDIYGLADATRRRANGMEKASTADQAILSRTDLSSAVRGRPDLKASSQATSARRKQEGRKKALMKKRVAQTARA
ncbi:conserved unknown protein [Ectocarpus siliculosus]|uniref:EF-hand domain-containing protein n=1 Tax=Ectocarpus siliculosus TaxID=2880 RepID=D7FPK3_ECTSI|nr:conserved unknown protein [Ectocarpus siliculosus]|eukprot:CBJ30460.1 conserved unknown protein [Ectocarpus siliculosus]